MISYDAQFMVHPGGPWACNHAGSLNTTQQIKRKTHGLISGNSGNLETVLRKHFKSEKEKAICTKILIVVLSVKLINQKQ